MSKADEMFEELGYKKFQQDENIGYAQIDETERMSVAMFNFKKKAVIVHYDNKNSIGITMQELQAINEKVKEVEYDENN